jgi:hypothetical protein
MAESEIVKNEPGGTVNVNVNVESDRRRFFLGFSCLLTGFLAGCTVAMIVMKNVGNAVSKVA